MSRTGTDYKRRDRSLRRQRRAKAVPAALPAPVSLAQAARPFSIDALFIGNGAAMRRTHHGC